MLDIDYGDTKEGGSTLFGDTKQHGGDKAWYSNEAVPNPRIQPPPHPNTHHLYIPDVPLEPPLITLTTATAAVAEGSRAIAYLFNCFYSNHIRRAFISGGGKGADPGA